MKHSVILIFFVFGTSYLTGQSAKEQQFEKTVKDAALKLAKGDSAGLSKYIEQNIGVYLLYKIGVSNTYKKFKTISFSDSSYPNLLFFYDKINIVKLKYASLPRYNCDDNTWSKKGAFADTVKIDHLLSYTARSLKKYNRENISQKTILNLNALELKSRRVVIASDNGNDLIFYLSYVNKKWFLTIIDTVSCDCST
jgi:hypothetical protein